MSFFPFTNRLTEWVYKATEPILLPCRKLLYKFNYNLPIDLSPMIALLAMQLIQKIIINVVFTLLVAF